MQFVIKKGRIKNILYKILAPILVHTGIKIALDMSLINNWVVMTSGTVPG